jgi:serine/threonine protein kinase
VKRLAAGSRQGENQFANEALLLSGVQHKNVVHLYGFCIHGDNRLLVYEYVANESLDKILFASSKSCLLFSIFYCKVFWFRILESLVV